MQNVKFFNLLKWDLIDVFIEIRSDLFKLDRTWISRLWYPERCIEIEFWITWIKYDFTISK